MRRYVLNKYVITVLVFAFMLTFCGENSIIDRVQRKQQIRVMEAELKNYQDEAAQIKANIEAIQGKSEALERFARETYYMHADGETVYIIEEDK